MSIILSAIFLLVVVYIIGLYQRIAECRRRRQNWPTDEEIIAASSEFLSRTYPPAGFEEDEPSYLGGGAFYCDEELPVLSRQVPVDIPDEDFIAVAVNQISRDAKVNGKPAVIPFNRTERDKALFTRVEQHKMARRSLQGDRG